MQLRNHPLMSSNGIPNWPPEWIWADGLRNTFIHPEGEVGILDNVRRSIVRPNSCLFVTIRHYGSVYLGRLTFDHQEFCHPICELLKANYGRSLTEIGSIEVLDAPDSLHWAVIRRLCCSMDIKDTDIGGLWSTHYAMRKTESRSLMFCLSIAHTIRNVAQNNPSDGIASQLRNALRCLDVPEDEFYQFIEETKSGDEL
jgi:hypothetical protein